MKKFVMAAVGGTVAGALIATQVAGPLIAQEAERKTSVYEQLDLFGDIFERIRAQYVEDVDEGEDSWHPNEVASSTVDPDEAEYKPIPDRLLEREIVFDATEMDDDDFDFF